MNNQYASMSPEEYIQNRLNNQQKYFSKKSSKYQTFYKILKITELSLIALIPLITIVPWFPNDIYNKVRIITLSVIATILRYFNIIGTYFDLWIKYRNISECLKTEKYYFLTGTDIYSDSETAFSLLIKRTESIILKANEQWSSTIKDIPKHIKKD